MSMFFLIKKRGCIPLLFDYIIDFEYQDMNCFLFEFILVLKDFN